MLVLLGIAVIIRAAFGIHIPLFRILLALLLFYMGISILVGARSQRSYYRRHVETSAPAPREQHDVIFGAWDTDLTNVELKGQVIRQEVSVVFGSGRIAIDPELPTRIDVSSAFAEVRMPDENNVPFGKYTYRTKSLDESKPYLRIKASVVFGRLDIIAIRPAETPKQATPP
jgi:hypothetical protein